MANNVGGTYFTKKRIPEHIYSNDISIHHLDALLAPFVNGVIGFGVGMNLDLSAPQGSR